MTNKEISKTIKLIAQLMEVHGENKFKIRSYENAEFQLGRLESPVTNMNEEELLQVKGLGKSLVPKIIELLNTGEIKYLNDYIAKTPAGIIEMLSIKGIGAGKIAKIWKELEIETPGELLYACSENRLVDLKGFGAKTQQQIHSILEYCLSNTGKFHYAAVESFAKKIVIDLKEALATNLISLTGSIRRKCELVEAIDIIIASQKTIDENFLKTPAGISVNIIRCKESEFYTELFKTTATEKHLKNFDINTLTTAKSEEEIYEKNQLPYIVPELREGIFEYDWIEAHNNADLILLKDLKGILHNHSTWSDGAHSLKEMANYCKELGYEYLGISDHSKSAFYANGLQVERVLAQQEEIDQLNKELAPFKILKGIEADILYNGDLDYEDSILKTFDFVVASVHSQLKMDESKANERLITAIENPYTTILGHPTSRLLLSREGYPIDHKKIIDACAANNVVIELNANPFRLDIDWRWIPYAMKKGVKISINPDAHKKEGYHDMYFGGCVA